MAIAFVHDIVIEAIFIVPEVDAIVGARCGAVVHGVGDVEEMFEEFGGDILVGIIFTGQFDGDGEHVEAEHGHPGGAVRLIEIGAGGERGGAIEEADVVEAEEAALEEVAAILVLAVDPPGEVDEQLLKDAFEEEAVALAADAALDAEDAQGGPGVDGRIDVAEGPFVGGELAAGMHEPFAQEEDELALGEIGIDQCQRDGVEGEIPGGVPGVFPGIGHGHDGVVGNVLPIRVAAGPTAGGGRWEGGVAGEPLFDVVIEKLFGPHEAGEGLALDVFEIVGGVFGMDGGVEGVGLLLALCEELIEGGTEGVVHGFWRSVGEAEADGGGLAGGDGEGVDDGGFFCAGVAWG